MEKVNIDLSTVVEIETSFSFYGNIIKIKPYINATNKKIMIQNYFEKVSDNHSDQYLVAEYGLILAILDLQTNLNIENFVIDQIFDSGLWYKIKPMILNLDEVYEDIIKIKALQSISNKFSNILTEVENLVMGLANVDLSEAGIEKLLAKLNEAKEGISQYLPDQQVAQKSKRGRPKKTS